MTRMYATGSRGVCFIIMEAATRKVWGISPDRKYAEQRATRIGETMNRDMVVEEQDKSGHIVSKTYVHVM